MKKSSLLLTIIIMIIILAIPFLFMCLPLGQTRGDAEDGKLDLRGDDLGGSVFQLTGDWQYTPGRIAEPEDFPDDASCIRVPHNWGGADDQLNTCATYRLKIQTDDARELTLYVPEIYTAYSLYINGERVRGAGIVADNAGEGRPSFESVLVPVRAVDGEMEIVIQASNYHWMRPHMNNVLKLSENDEMFSWFFRTRVLYILALGFILASVFYHFALYIMRRRMMVYLLFALLCLFCFWRLALETDGISDLTGWFSMSSGVLDARIYLVLFFLHGAFIAVFSLYVFDRKWLMKNIWLALGYCAAGVVAFAFLPVNVSWITYVFMLAAMVPVLLALYKALRSRVLRVNKIMWMYVAALIAYIVVGAGAKYFADHLLYMTPVLTNLYMIMAESVILARQYSDAVVREQKLAAKTVAMEQSAKVRSYMIDTLSHEVRTPLTVMSSYAQLAVERISEGQMDELTLANLRKISEESKRLADLASSTLRLSRLSDIPDGGEFTPINIGELAEQVALLFEPMTIKNGRKLIHNISDNVPQVKGSADSLTRLIWNLLDNALTHGAYGDIEIAVSAEGNAVSLTVEDHGAGVPPEILVKVFEHGVSGRRDGTGIGLNMSREIAREMNGSITLDSNFGEGTTVTLTLPAMKNGL